MGENGEGWAWAGVVVSATSASAVLKTKIFINNCKIPKLNAGDAALLEFRDTTCIYLPHAPLKADAHQFLRLNREFHGQFL